MAEKITIKIETGNAAFDESPATEIARILRKIAKDFERDGTSLAAHDINGNLVATVKVSRK